MELSSCTLNRSALKCWCPVDIVEQGYNYESELSCIRSIAHHHMVYKFGPTVEYANLKTIYDTKITYRLKITEILQQKN